MSTSPKFLDEAFKDALSNASTLDQQGIIPDNTEELYPAGPPTHLQLVQECLDFYNQHHVVMDRAIQGALNFVSTPEGVAQVKALEGSFEAGANDTLSVELASEMLSSGKFGLTKVTEDVQGLDGFGIGVSAGLSAVIGLLGGADVVFEKDQVIPRTWGGVSFKGGLSISLGLELSFWTNTPLDGAIAGTLLDLYIPQTGVTLFLRFMYIKMRETGTTEFTPSAASLQFPFGFGLPLRIIHGQKYPGVVAGFAAKQNAAARNRRSTFDVVNQATGVDTIAVQETTTLVGTLKNTSGTNFSLSAGATITLGMPSYFTATDVSQMSGVLQGWKYVTDGNDLILTLQSAFTWQSGSVLSINITNVRSSNTPPKGQESQPGVVKLKMSDTSFDYPIVNNAEFDLVWANSHAYLVWKTTMQSDYTLSGPPSGNTDAYAQPGSDVMTLTTATKNSTGDTWVLGYIFNYNSDTLTPQVAAVWWKKDAPKTGSNLLVGNWVSTSGQFSNCFNTTGSSMSINVTFD